MAQGPGRPLSEPTDLALYAVAGGLGLVGVLWLGGATSALLVGHRVGRDDVFAGLAAFGYVGDPSRAWHVPVGPALLYWSVTGTALLLAAALTIAIGRLLSVESRRKGDDPTTDCRPRRPSSGQVRFRCVSPAGACGDLATVSASSSPG